MPDCCDPTTALHSALGLGHWETSVYLLTDGHPGGITHGNPGGITHGHPGVSPTVLCRKGIKDGHTNATDTHADTDTRHPILPLHIALANNAPHDVVSLLLTTAPETGKVRKRERVGTRERERKGERERGREGGRERERESERRERERIKERERERGRERKRERERERERAKRERGRE